MLAKVKNKKIVIGIIPRLRIDDLAGAIKMLTRKSRPRSTLNELDIKAAMTSSA